MLAVYKRELKAVFHSMIGWIFIAAILFFVSLYFSIYNLGQGYPYVSIVLSSIVFVMILAVPILTMRIMTEDKRMCTDRLLYTAPVKSISVILGKYFAMLTVFAIPMVYTCILPIFLGLFGKVPYKETYISILGFFLFGAACIAIGLFVSSLTENQIVAAVLGFVFLFLGYMMSGICGFMSQEGNLLTKILGCYSFYDRIQTVFDGVLDVPSFIYFITLSVVFLFFTYEVLQKKRFSVATGRISRSAFSAGLIVVVIAVAVLANFGVSKLPENIKQIDTTDEGLYGITDTTAEYLSKLDQDINIYVLSSEDGADSIVKRMLEKYKASSKHINVEYKDPSLYPEFSAKYGESISYGSVIVESDKRFKVVSDTDLYEMDMDYQTYQQIVTGYDGEGRITSAIAYVLSDDMPKLYQICGHSELALSGESQTSIEKENIELATLNLMDVDAIPEDAAGIAIIAPVSDISEDDAGKIRDYLDNGGKAVIITSYTDQGTPNLLNIFKDYGLSLTEGIVVDPAVNYYYQSPYLLLPDVLSTIVTADISSQKRYVLLPYAQGIKVDEESAEGEDDDLTVYQILKTSEDAYCKTNLEDAENWEKEDGDEEGPFAVGVWVVKNKTEEENTEFLWITSENILSENANALVSGSNYELLTNMVARMKGDEINISIPVKNYMAESFTVPRLVFFLGFAVSVVILPLALIATGLIIWLNRRKK